MIINKVTITGPDDKTDLLRLVELTRKYPFVEWGLLFSTNKAGTSRYPSKEWIENAVNLGSLPLSAHFCGWWSREIFEKQNFEHISELKGFNRVQLNYNFSRSKKWNFEQYLDFAKKVEISMILQYNKSNSKLLDTIVNGFFDAPENIDFLYDSSGGRGTEIEKIESPIKNSYTGYAGGLGEDNIERICKLITEHPDNSEVWIDLETGARDENDDFDLDKVERILEKVSNYVKTKQFS
jgi:phosphoribosylanthranilate isomerase